MSTDAVDHPRRLGDYEILDSLGKGSMGEVFKAVESSRNRIVAIKVLGESFAAEPEWVERFDREANAVEILHHPNVVQIIEKGREGDTFYFVMEYVPGSSLAAILRQRRLSLAEALAVTRAVGRGLEAAHRQNIVHRDLSPRNVLVSDDFSVIKIADFGISRVEALSRDLGTLSTSEINMGTLHYMAPEQAEGMSTVDHRADIYSLGVLFYEMLTGRVPVGRFSLPSQLNNEVPSTIDPVVLRCLKTSPGDRYPSVSMLLEEIGRIEDRLRIGLVDELKGISRGTSKFLRPTTSFLRRGGTGSILPWLFGVAGVVALAAVGLLWMRGQGGATAEPGAAPSAVEEPATEAAVGVVTDEREAPGDRTVATESEKAGDDASAASERSPQPPVAPEPQAALSRPQPPPATPAPAASAAAPPEEIDPAAAEDLQVALDKVEAGLLGPARADLERWLERRQEHPRAPDAYLALAALHATEGRAEQALATYVELRSRHSGSPQAAEAAFHQARLTESGGRGREVQTAAAELFGEVAGDYPESPWAPRALVERARLEREAKLEVNDAELGLRVPAAVPTWRALVAGYPDDPAVEAALWNLAETYEELKRFELAAETYAELGERFPATAYDAWWKAGQLFDRKLEDPERALAAYARVPERSRQHGAAEKRIRKLSD